MPNSIFSDDSFRSAKIALDGLSLRQQLVGRNIANVDTPGYKAQTVDFEKTLKLAMDKKTPFGITATNPGHLAAPSVQAAFMSSMRPGGSSRADGNNVDIDVEMTEMSADVLRYQALTESVSKKLALLKSIAR